MIRTNQPTARTRACMFIALLLTLAAPFTHSSAARDTHSKPTSKQRARTYTGRLLIEVDSKSGHAIRARLLKSTGSQWLDEAAVKGFLKARFKPGTARRFEVPINARMTEDG